MLLTELNSYHKSNHGYAGGSKQKSEKTSRSTGIEVYPLHLLTVQLLLWSLNAVKKV